MTWEVNKSLPLQQNVNVIILAQCRFWESINYCIMCENPASITLCPKVIRYSETKIIFFIIFNVKQQSNITQESLLSWRSPLRSAKFMLAGLIPHRNQWAKRKGGQQRPPSSRTIVIALDNIELYFF